MRAREFINEVRMSPKYLEKMASSIDAHAGMEFEMYVPNVGRIAIDVSAEISPRSIDHICNIFGENPNNDVELIRQHLMQDYIEWTKDQANERWDDAGYDEDVGSDFYNSFIEEYMLSHDSAENMRRWFKHKGLGSMGEVAMEYDIDLPMAANESLDALAEEFGDMINRPVITSVEYHGIERDEVSYIIEPDGTLDEPRADDDMGLEFISPPLPLEEMVFDLENVIHWAKQYGCYTTEKCGLHMNVSLDHIPMENLDYVKLAIFSGDDYILENFGRLGSEQAIRSMNDIEQKIDKMKQSGDAIKFLQQAQTRLASIAHKVIHLGLTTHKISLNVHANYVEFRQPGGDWLNISPKQLISTLNRFVVALEIACDPTKYQEEYAKKLYRLLDTSQQSNNMMKIFARYSSKTLTPAQLKYILQVKNRDKLSDTGNASNVWRVSVEKSSPSFARHSASYNPMFVDVRGQNEEDAIKAAVKILGDEYKSIPVSQFDVKLLDPK
jgi:hypothetical protein